MADTTQLVVLGAGPGGYAAAFYAADLGMQVALVDEEKNPGGVCLYRGCIPSKALLHVAKVIDEAKHAGNWGVTYSEPKLDVDKLRGFKQGVVDKLTAGVGSIAKMRKVTFVQGRATLTGPRSMSVAGPGGTTELQFEHLILATGSHPTKIPTLSLDSPRMMDSTSGLELPDVPKSLLVIGGGYIGLELGTVYAALGSKVSVVEMTPGLLPGADRDLVGVLEKRLKRLFAAIMLNTKVVKVALAEKAARIRVTFEGDRRRRRSSCSIACSSPSAAGPTRRFPASRRRRSRSRRTDSSRRTSSGGPPSRTSSRSATSPASRCWRTRRRTKPASRWK